MNSATENNSAMNDFNSATITNFGTITDIELHNIYQSEGISGIRKMIKQIGYTIGGY